ncbi:hypothetical protein MMC27_005965 [Xylographa pallens]|nr:hypothetical protein [Xylographa pallens]
MTALEAVSGASPNVMAATNSRLFSPPAAVDTTKSPLFDDASGDIDSGYASIADTPEGSPENSRDGFNNEILLPSRSLFKRKVTKLGVFEKPIMLQTVNRFNDLNELFGKDLYNYLANAKIKHSAVSIKLKVFGEDEDSAKPGIVVLCNTTVTKRVRRFFNQPQVKSEYQPRDSSLCLPSFEIVVCDRPPKLMASALPSQHQSFEYNVALQREADEPDPSSRHRLTFEQTNILETMFQQDPKPPTNTKKDLAQKTGLNLNKVNNWYQNRRAKVNNIVIPASVPITGSGEHLLHATLVNIYGKPPAGEATLCGMMVKADHPEQGRVATLGGIIMITSMDGDVMLYGMTVGHILKEERSNKGDLDIEEENDHFVEDEECFFEEDESFEIDLPLEEVQELFESNSAGDVQDTEGYPAQPNVLWSKIGNVIQVSRDDRGDQTDLDWALIQFADPSYYRPNHVPLLFQSSTNAYEEPREMDQGSTGTEQSQPVMLVGGTKGLKLGFLSMSKSFLMLASGRGFVATYDLVMQDQEVLEPGDCGSWAVNYVTNEVYGHVVGSDVFGEAYIVPLHSTLAQMKERFAAASVRLPRQVEVAAWLSLQAEALAKPLPPPSTPELSSLSETKSFRKVNYEEVIALALSMAEGPLSPTSSAIDPTAINTTMIDVDELSDSENLSELDDDVNEMDSGYGSRNTSTQSSAWTSPSRFPISGPHLNVTNGPMYHPSFFS